MNNLETRTFSLSTTYKCLDPHSLAAFVMYLKSGIYGLITWIQIVSDVELLGLFFFFAFHFQYYI